MSETRDITVATDKGPVLALDAMCDRGLAIHKAVGFGEDWVVTHIASGRRLLGSLRRYQDALYAMGVLLSWGCDWTATDMGGVKGLPDRVKKLQKEMGKR